MLYQTKKTFTTLWISLLTFGAGAINATAIFLLDKTITHHTGSLSKAAIALGEGNWLVFLDLFSYLSLFFIGAFVSGYTTAKRNRGVRYLHSFYPILFGALLILSYFAQLNTENILRLMAFGMGLQNGTHIRLHSIQIRTTHMTGYLTDAAVSLGKVLRGQKEERIKAFFILYSIFVFFLGGVLSILINLNYGLVSLLILGAIYILVGVLVFVFHPKQF